MSTTSFGEQAIAALENQVDATPQTPRRRVKRKTWQTVIWFVVLLAITAIVLYPLVWLFLSTFKPNSRVRLEHRACSRTTRPSRTTPRSSEGIAGVPMWRFFANSLHHRRRLGDRRRALLAPSPRTRSPASSSRASASSSPR